MTKTTAKLKKSKSSSKVTSKAKKQSIASVALNLSLINAVFALLFVALVIVLNISMPEKSNSVAEFIGWTLLAINFVVTPFIAIVAVFFSVKSLSVRKDMAQSVTALSVVILSGIIFTASWGISIS